MVRAAARWAHTQRVKTVLRVLYTCAAGASLVWACGGDGALSAPKSDSQFDDGEDPGSGPPGGGTRPDASGDAQGRVCAADRDCPASHKCSFAVSGGCSATGACMIYSPDAACASTVACGCSQKDVPLCAPAGFAPEPIAHAGSCNPAPDAGTADTSVPDDANGSDANGSDANGSDAPAD